MNRMPAWKRQVMNEASKLTLWRFKAASEASTDLRFALLGDQWDEDVLRSKGGQHSPSTSC